MPEHISLTVVVLLVAVWNASVGPSGAITFASMAIILPPFAVVPIHATVEAVSAFFRTILLREYIDWSYAAYFCAGAFLGFLVGGAAFYSIPLTDGFLRTALGCTILFVTWIRLPYISGKRWQSASVVGATLTSFMTVFIGATGPLVTALVQQRLPDHRKTLGTSAACMTLQHSGKIVVFGVIGFSFTQYAQLILYLAMASFIGSWIGRHILITVPQWITKSVLRVILTALALHLIWAGAAAS